MRSLVADHISPIISKQVVLSKDVYLYDIFFEILTVHSVYFFVFTIRHLALFCLHGKRTLFSCVAHFAF